MAEQGFLTRLKTTPPSVALVVYLIAVFIFSSIFLVNMQDVNIWDETYYIHSGRMLWQGELVTLARSPLASILYGLTYLPFTSSPFWLLLSNSLGRFLLFSLLYWATWFAGTTFDDVPPAVPIIFLLLSPIVLANYNFPSDLLLAGFATLAFAHILKFRKSKKIKHTWLTSLFLGLAALSRAEGLVLFVVSLVFLVIFALPKPNWKKLIPAAIIPFVVLVGSYLLVYGIVTGRFETGLADRTYDNFEAGHETIYSDTDTYGSTVEAIAESMTVFGTREENNTSVFRAILNNPPVYFQRIKMMLRGLPIIALQGYGIKLSVLIFLLAIRGVIALLRRKAFPLLGFHLAWLLPLAPVMVNTFMRVGYLRMPFVVVFSLASIGLIQMLKNIHSKIEPVIWSVVSITIAAVSWFAGIPAVYYGASLFLAGYIVVYLLNNVWKKGLPVFNLSLVLLLVFGVIIYGNLPGVKKYALGESPAEQSVKFLHDQYPENTAVLSASPLPIFMARHDLYNLNSTDIPDFSDSETFLNWVTAQDISLIYIDSLMPPEFYGYAMDLLEKGRLERVFEIDQGNYQVLAVVENE